MDLSVKIKTEPVDDNENKTDECIFTTPYSQAEATQIAIGVAIANTPDQGNPVIVGLNEEGQIVNIQSDDNAYGVIATTNTGITAGYLINEDKKSIKRKGVEYICEPDFNGEPPPSKKKYKCTKKRSYPCSVEGCYYATSSTVNLTSHMLGKHPGKQTHPDHLICKECGHKASSKAHMKNRTTTIHDSRYKALIRRVTELRKLTGLSQKELAQAIGVSQSDISKVERCERRLDIIELYDVLWYLAHQDQNLFDKYLTEIYSYSRMMNVDDRWY